MDRDMTIALLGLSCFFLALQAIITKIQRNKRRCRRKVDERYLHLGRGMILIDGEYREF